MVSVDQARFLQRTKHGKKWKLLRKQRMRDIMKLDFSKACKDLAKRQRDYEQDAIDRLVAQAEAEVYGKETKKTSNKQDPSAEHALSHQEQVFFSLWKPLIPTKMHHCGLDLAKVEHGMIFSFAKAFSNNSSRIESLELYTSPMSLATAGALA